MILIESPDGSEKCLVASMAGYDGWTLVASDVIKPEAGCYWDDAGKSWKVDATARGKQSALAKVKDPAALLEIIDDLTARIVALEAAANG